MNPSMSTGAILARQGGYHASGNRTRRLSTMTGTHQLVIGDQLADAVSGETFDAIDP